MDEPNLIVPDYNLLDPDKIEVFLDVDLDAFMVLFYGRDREHYVHSMNGMLSYLLDVDTNEVVGISLDRFARQVLLEHPFLREDVPMATLLYGGFVGHISDLEPRPTTVWGRLRYAVRAGKRACEVDTNKEPVRHLLSSLPTLAETG